MRHSPPVPTDTLYGFGPFLVDPVIGRLYCGSDDVPLTRKTFEFLVILVARRGELVEKEELFKLIWPDTIVEENNLARCASMLRKALRERDADQEFVTTVPGRGYRLAVPVEVVERGASTIVSHDSMPVGPSSVSRAFTAKRVAPFGRWMTVGALLVAATMALIAARHASRASLETTPNRRLTLFASMGGFDVEPAWSPDGQFIAYSSNKAGDLDIWVQSASGGTPLRVTHADAADSQPAWSPDGRRIAFRSERDGGGLFVVSAFGGPVDRITDFGHRPMWSPDGQRLLFYASAHPLQHQAFVATLDGSAPVAVAPEVLATFGQCKMAWHPDGRRISVLGQVDGRWRFLTMAVDGANRVESTMAAEVATLLRDSALNLGDFVWSRDGRAIFVEGHAGQTQNIWRITLDPDTLRWIAGPTRLTTSTNTETDIALSPDGQRLAFSSRSERTRAWAFPINAATGRLNGAGAPVTPDGTDVSLFDVSRDGDRLAYRTVRNGQHELWVRSLLGTPEEIEAVEEHASIGLPRWSPDGATLAYLRGGRQPSALVLLNWSNKGEKVVNRTSVSNIFNVFDWGPHGASLLVGCGASGRSAICRLELVGSRPHQIDVIAADARRALYQARYSPDFRWVSFVAADRRLGSTVYVMPAAGGPWVPLTDGGAYDDKPRWSPDSSTIYFLSDRSGHPNIWARRLVPATGQPDGRPFEVTHFDTADRMIPTVFAPLQIGLTQSRLVVPIRETNASVWVLDAFARP
jgi:Tol biopolymer transport system component/DNA-binding winged helix-turn-helix (wHTH) protein